MAAANASCSIGGAVDADALAVAVQMRTDVIAGAQACGAQDRFDHDAGAAFSFRASDVDGRAAEMRIAKLGEQRAHRRQVGPIGEVAAALEVRQRQKPAEGVVVVHGGRVTGAGAEAPMSAAGQILEGAVLTVAPHRRNVASIPAAERCLMPGVRASLRCRSLRWCLLSHVAGGAETGSRGAEPAFVHELSAVSG